MKRMVMAVAALALLAAGKPGTESKWEVKKGSSAVATVTLLTSAGGDQRAEWKASASKAPIVFLSTRNVVWVRQSGGDIELKDYKGGAEKTVVPALFAGKSSIDGYKLTKLSSHSSNADASTFTIRPKKGAAQRLSRLSGDLFGPTSSSASATAGGRGVGGSGLKLKDGGNYDALTKLEERDAGWKTKLDDALTEFQKDGKVGKERSE